MSYDQWKTASPFDDEPDYLEIAEKWLERNSYLEKLDARTSALASELKQVHEMVSALVYYITEEL